MDNHNTTGIVLSTNSSSSSPFQMSQLSHPILALCFSLISSEFLLHCACLPISALNAFLISTTALLHRNLKLLLLLQSVSISAMSLLQLVRLFFKLLHLDVFFNNALTLVLFYPGYLLCMMFIDWLAFTLLLERFLATMFSRTYEDNGRPHFFIFCLIFLALAPCCCYYFLVDSAVPNGIDMDASTQYALYGFAVLSFLGILAFFALYEYNKRRYAFLAASRERSHLSERYQVSENIRTTRQLFPSAILHFLLALLSLALSLFSYYGITTKSATAQALVLNPISLLFVASCIAIQISVITMHPLLNRRAKQLFGTMKMASLWRNRAAVRPQQPQGAIVSSGSGDGATVEEANWADGNGQSQQHRQSVSVPLNLFGNELYKPGKMDMTEYFRVLDTLWNKGPEKKMNKMGRK